MATKLDEFPPVGGSRPRYPWDEWFDGAAWELRRGEDFTIAVENMRSVAYAAAKSHGLRCRISTPDRDRVIVQAYPRDASARPA